jgi:hypothetical protein
MKTLVAVFPMIGRSVHFAVFGGLRRLSEEHPFERVSK